MAQWPGLRKQPPAAAITDDRLNDMLILTRKVNESLIVGDNITITVLGVKGNQVRIGVDAPKDVSVHRKEIYQRIADKPSEDNEPS